MQNANNYPLIFKIAIAFAAANGLAYIMERIWLA